MKIVLAGGGTGGHFYPLVAVAEKLNEVAVSQKLTGLRLFYFGDAELDKTALFENNIAFVKIPSGKMRGYFSLRNFSDFFVIIFGITVAIVKLFFVYPDAVFGKGGYASFPTLVAARLLMIPVIIHESDSVPGRVNRFAGKFAYKIAVSFASAASYFPLEKVARTGLPIRSALLAEPDANIAETMRRDKSVPMVLCIGGSQGAKLINDALLSALPRLFQICEILHITGEVNFEDITRRAALILKGEMAIGRYRAFPYLDSKKLRAAGAASSLVISRAGSGIFEIGQWGKPMILIPISESVNNHQQKNAYILRTVGAAAVIEESNLSPNILTVEIENLLKDANGLLKMGEEAKNFAPNNAAEIISRELIKICLKHENG